MKEFVARQLSARLGRLAFQIRRARKTTDEDAVHDLRVAIRRFWQVLKTFRQFLPKREARKIRKELRTVMDLAGAVRDLDIAIGLAKKAKLAEDSPTAARFRRDRKQAADQLARGLRPYHRTGFSKRWREKLS